MMSDQPAGCGASSPGGLRIGTWNMSHWSQEKMAVVMEDIAADVLAVQETHLAALPLEHAHKHARSLGLSLHLGLPVQALRASDHGRSCGVGFLAAQGVALSHSPPVGAAWRMLHSLRRLHAVRLPPRHGLPHGVLLISLYAPLSTQPVERSRFDSAFLEFTHTLDLQTPTLLMGDFNGSICPPRDFRSVGSQRRPPCTLLSNLLGPGGAWTDVHATLLPPPLPWTYELTMPDGSLAASRIDLILCNQAARPLLHSATVLNGIQHGGHSPVLLSLRLSGPTHLNWQQPRPKPPRLLLLPSADLRHNPEWLQLLQSWESSPQVAVALSPDTPHTAPTLSQAMLAALHYLVHLAGGWQQRPSARRAAYDSNRTRLLRRQLAALQRLLSLLRRPLPSSPGCWPRPCLLLLEELHTLHLLLPQTTIPELLAAAIAHRQDCANALAALHHTMRQKRHHRWKSLIPQLWRDRPVVIHR